MVEPVSVVVVLPLHGTDGTRIDVGLWSGRFSGLLERLCSTPSERLANGGLMLVRGQVDQLALFRRGALDPLRAELSRFRQEAGPSEVGIVVGDTYFGISGQHPEPHPTGEPHA